MTSSDAIISTIGGLNRALRRSVNFKRSALFLKIQPRFCSAPELRRTLVRVSVDGGFENVMSESKHEYEVSGEVIKLIHGELPAVRWTCGGCGEDSCTIFYEAETVQKLICCEYCGSSNRVTGAD
jgi:hypothetical protein